MAELAISKQTKKMLLFVSTANRFWGPPLLSGQPSQNAIAKYIGVAHGTIPSWKNGGKISPETASDVFLETKSKISNGKLLKGQDRERLLATLDAFIESFYDDKISVYTVAEILGMDIEICQKIIDEVIYRRGPVFPRMYHDSKSEAEEYFNQYKGIFYVWVRRSSFWLKGVMHVRYVLEIGGGFTIRCKFNFPVIDSDNPDRHWEYDGFLVRKANRIFWMFEKRQRDRNDLFYFVTGTGKSYIRIEGDRDKKDRTLSGQYLTAGQDELQSVVADRILLQRIAYNDPNEPRKTIEIMHETVKVISDRIECQNLDQALADFELPRKNGEPPEAMRPSG